MKNCRYSEISESDDSNESPKTKNASIFNTSKINNHSSSSESLDSSSESREESSRKSSLKKQRRPSGSPKKTANVLENFILQNSELSRLNVIDAISEDDDVCFLEIPKNINPEELLNREIKFHKKTKLKINKTKYIIEPNFENIKPFTVLTSNLKIIHPVASLQLREYVKQKEDSESVLAAKCTPTLPKNLKVRHPLFGAKYENKIILDEKIQHKLDNTIDSFLKKIKKKKQKQKERNETNETIFTLLESHTSTHKKKKHKKQHSVDEKNIEPTYSSLEADTLDKEAENSFEKKRKKHKKKRNEEREHETEPENTSFELNIHEKEPEVILWKKKKHKKKKSESDEINQTENFENAQEEENRKFKNKKINIINSTIIPGLKLPPFEFDISGIMNKEEKSGDDELKADNEPVVKKKKKKKKKRESEENIDVAGDKNNSGQTVQDESFYNGVETSDIKRSKKRKERSDEVDDGPSPKKKRKKEKKDETEATNSLIKHILSSVKSQMDNPVAKHKKKKTDR